MTDINITNLSPELALEVRRIVRESLDDAVDRNPEHGHYERNSNRTRFRGKASSQIGSMANPTSPVGTGTAELYTLNTAANTFTNLIHGSAPIKSTLDSTIEVGDWFWCEQDQYGDFWVETGGVSSGGSGHPRFQFVATGKIVDRVVTVKVLRVINEPPKLSEAGTLVYGDTIDIHDPFNKWSDIEPGSTGWAVLCYAQADDGDTEDIDEEHPQRYEIVDASHPIDEMEGLAQKCVWGDGNSFQCIIEQPIGSGLYGNVLSSYPKIDNPPTGEILDGTSSRSPPTDYKYITVENPYNLDCVAGSFITIKRRSSREASDPENYETPLSRSSVAPYYWVLTSVEKKFARHIEVEYNGGIWSKTAEFDGFWPEPTPADVRLEGCTPSITCDHDECLNNGDIGYAFFDSNEGEYKVYTTNSAFYGSPEDAQVMTDATLADCTLSGSKSTIKVFCPPVAGGGITGGSIQTTTRTVATGSTIAIEECTGTCAWRWDYPTSECAQGGVCTWEWDSASGPTGDWVRKTGDPNCPTGCTCNKPAYPEDPGAMVDGDETTTNCVVEDTGAGLGWQKIRSCSGDCDCPEPATNGTSPGEERTSQCDIDGDGDGTKQLCVTTERISFTTIVCSSSQLNSTAEDPQKSCIPIEEDCPDACANPVS